MRRRCGLSHPFAALGRVALHGAMLRSALARGTMLRVPMLHHRPMLDGLALRRTMFSGAMLRDAVFHGHAVLRVAMLSPPGPGLLARLHAGRGGRRAAPAVASVFVVTAGSGPVRP